jgi:hypothetical protein
MPVLTCACLWLVWRVVPGQVSVGRAPSWLRRDLSLLLVLCSLWSSGPPSQSRWRFEVWVSESLLACCPLPSCARAGGPFGFLLSPIPSHILALSHFLHTPFASALLHPHPPSSPALHHHILPLYPSATAQYHHHRICCNCSNDFTLPRTPFTITFALYGQILCVVTLVQQTATLKAAEEVSKLASDWLVTSTCTQFTFEPFRVQNASILY